MTDWQFSVLVALLLWILWQTRSIAKISPWLRDALLRRIFKQLNDITEVVVHYPGSSYDLEEEAEKWWQCERAWEAGRPKGIWSRATCGPWCHEDWNRQGIKRLDEIEFERSHPHQESEESKKDEFELIKRQEDGSKLHEYQYRLGCFYESGWGVAKDQSEALNWYRKAAEQGDRNAQGRLASAYFDGDGVTVDHATAYFWLKLSKMPYGVDAVGDLLNLEQRAEVEQRCREWMESRHSVTAAGSVEKGTLQ